jgi:peptide/nickel transport system substrate-binding protein
MELKAVLAAVFFSSDPANPDTSSHFYADLPMYSLFMGRPDPQRFMESFTSWEVTAKENKWSLGNRSRWRNEDYDRLWRASERELDPLPAHLRGSGAGAPDRTRAFSSARLVAARAAPSRASSA